MKTLASTSSSSMAGAGLLLLLLLTVAALAQAQAARGEHLNGRDLRMAGGHGKGGKGGKGKGTRAPSSSPSWFACEADTDCVSIKDPGCCPCGNVAVNKDEVGNYVKANNCSRTDVMCPMIFCPPDQRVPLCTYVGKSKILQCQLENVNEIPCNGFTRPSHACPDGYRCQLPPGMADVPGKCVKAIPCAKDADCPNPLFKCSVPDNFCVFDPSRVTNATATCGGITGKPCPPIAGGKLTCADDPRDNCDPTAGGADCGGLCVPDGKPVIRPCAAVRCGRPNTKCIECPTGEGGQLQAMCVRPNGKCPGPK